MKLLFSIILFLFTNSLFGQSDTLDVIRTYYENGFVKTEDFYSQTDLQNFKRHDKYMSKEFYNNAQLKTLKKYNSSVQNKTDSFANVEYEESPIYIAKAYQIDGDYIGDYSEYETYSIDEFGNEITTVERVFTPSEQYRDLGYGDYDFISLRKKGETQDTLSTVIEYDHNTVTTIHYYKNNSRIESRYFTAYGQLKKIEFKGYPKVLDEYDEMTHTYVSITEVYDIDKFGNEISIYYPSVDFKTVSENCFFNYYISKEAKDYLASVQNIELYEIIPISEYELLSKKEKRKLNKSEVQLYKQLFKYQMVVKEDGKVITDQLNFIKELEQENILYLFGNKKIVSNPTLCTYIPSAVIIFKNSDGSEDYIEMCFGCKQNRISDSQKMGIQHICRDQVRKFEAQSF